MGNGWSIAWRLHDAQYWGVPQRRKRICLLADFNGNTAPKILFELLRATDEGDTNQTLMDTGGESKPKIHPISESLPRDTEQSREEGQSITSNSEGSSDATSFTIKIRGGREVDSYGKKAGKGALIQTELSATLGVSQDQTLITMSLDEKMGNTYIHEEMGNTLGARDYKQPQVVFCYDMDNERRRGVTESEISPALTQRMGTGGNNVPSITYQDVSGALSPGAHAGSYNGQDAYNDMLIANTSVARRLTPLECERLQGFPDHWTDIGEWTDSKGKKHKDADSPRYKALGNSIALPFWQWLAERIVTQYDRPTTMASLFDGIGGFPLVFSRSGCEPVWASEIEEFPMAVTKLRIKES